MAKQSVSLNGPTLTVVPRAEEPLRLTEQFASTTSATGEKLEILTLLGNPTKIVIRGEKLVGDIDLSSVLQEALLHVLRENAK